MGVREQLSHLIRIQELAIAIQEARAVVEDSPARVEEIEGRFRERNVEYVALKERHDALDADRKARTLELETLEVDKKKFMDALMQVKNQREYAAVLKEIDTVKARIGEHDDAILKAMEETEKLAVDLAKFAEHIEKERAQVASEVAEVEAAVARAKETIERSEEERGRLEADLPRPLVSSLRRIEEGRRGIFLAKVEGAMCTACHVRVRPQVFNEIRQASKLHTCGSCKRFLVAELSLPGGPDGPNGAPHGGGDAGVHAVNGGAV